MATLTPYQCNPQGCENATVPAGAKAPKAMPAPLQCVQASTSPSDAGPACARQPRGHRMTLCMHWQTFKNVHRCCGPLTQVRSTQPAAAGERHARGGMLGARQPRTREGPFLLQRSQHRSCRAGAPQAVFCAHFVRPVTCPRFRAAMSYDIKTTQRYTSYDITLCQFAEAPGLWTRTKKRLVLVQSPTARPWRRPRLRR